MIASYLVPVLVLAFVVWRMARRARPVKPSRLWIRPAIFALFLVAAFSHSLPLNLISFVVFTAAAGLGLGLGYVLASHQQLTIDPTTGKITSKMSPVGVALFAGLYAARYLFRRGTLGDQLPEKVMAHSAQVLMWTDAGLIFVLALVSAQAWEIWRRAKPLLDDHAAKKAESPAQ